MVEAQQQDFTFVDETEEAQNKNKSKAPGTRRVNKTTLMKLRKQINNNQFKKYYFVMDTNDNNVLKYEESNNNIIKCSNNNSGTFAAVSKETCCSNSNYSNSSSSTCNFSACNENRPTLPTCNNQKSMMSRFLHKKHKRKGMPNSQTPSETQFHQLKDDINLDNTPLLHKDVVLSPENKATCPFLKSLSERNFILLQSFVACLLDGNSMNDNETYNANGTFDFANSNPVSFPTLSTACCSTNNNSTEITPMDHYNFFTKLLLGDNPQFQDNCYLNSHNTEFHNNETKSIDNYTFNPSTPTLSVNDHQLFNNNCESTETEPKNSIFPLKIDAQSMLELLNYLNQHQK
ncbi:hypothetical protein ABK040_008692 [Willaertia magna]